MAQKKRKQTRRAAAPKRSSVKTTAFYWKKTYIIALPVFAVLIGALSFFAHSDRQAVGTVLGVATAQYRSGEIQWRPVPGATGYNIYYYEQNDTKNINAVRGLPATSTSYTINYLKKNSGYQYTIKALDETGAEFWSSQPKWIWQYK